MRSGSGAPRWNPYLIPPCQGGLGLGARVGLVDVEQVGSAEVESLFNSPLPRGTGLGDADGNGQFGTSAERLVYTLPIINCSLVPVQRAPLGKGGWGDSCDRVTDRLKIIQHITVGKAQHPQSIPLKYGRTR
jgi:hypothetical protein